MRARKIFTVTWKDWIEVRQNRFAIVPMIIVSLVFIVLIPLLFTIILPGLDMVGEDFVSEMDLEMLFNAMPAVVREEMMGLQPAQAMIVIVLGYLFAPMFLMLPLMFATIIAAESFAGERERKTIEVLLYTPATEMELFIGKVMAAFLPAMGLTWACFILYILILNLGPYSLFGRIWFPLPAWWPLIFWMAPALVLLGICVSVLISSKVQTFMGAYQTSSSVVLLVVVLFVGQISGVLYLSVGIVLLLGLFVWMLAGIIFYFAVQTFNRQKLL